MVDTNNNLVMSNTDKVFKAIERLINGFVVNLHDEATGYCFKVYSTGEWKTVDFDFANGLAGLGNVNRSLL